MAEAEDPKAEERLKSALWFSIGKIVDEETIKLGANATPHFIGALTELVWNQIESASVDAEMFARHANRQTITTDDVLMLSRRNEGLEELMRTWLKKEQSGKEKRKAGGKAAAKK